MSSEKYKTYPVDYSDFWDKKENNHSKIKKQSMQDHWDEISRLFKAVAINDDKEQDEQSTEIKQAS